MQAHLQNFSETSLLVIQVVKAIHGQVHHVDGIAVIRAPSRPISPVKELVAMVVPYPAHQRCHYLCQQLIEVEVLHREVVHKFVL